MESKIKVIIADDNRGVCYFVERFLEKYEDVEIVGITDNLKEEIKLIEEKKPDVVITDLRRINGENGDEAIKLYDGKLTPAFIVYTAYNKLETRYLELQYGIKYFVRKPSDGYDDLICHLREIKEKLNRGENVKVCKTMKEL